MTKSDDTAKKDGKKKTLTISSPSKLQLTKTVEGGNVQQKFTHGRSKNVTVEVRKTRTYQKGTGGMVEIKGGGRKVGADGLTDEERNARLKALEGAGGKKKPLLQKLAHQQLDDEAEEKTDSTAADAARRDDGVIISPLLKKQKEEKTAKATTKKEEKVDKFAGKDDAPAAGTTDEKGKEKRELKGKLKLKGVKSSKVRTGKLSLSAALGGEEGRTRSLASIKRQREKAQKKAMGISAGPQEKVMREVTIPETITVQELANRMTERSVDVVKELMKLGMMVTATQSIDADTAELVVSEFGHTFKRVAESDVESIATDDIIDSEESLESRPPVVTIMGHVDHGKTSLLDALRETDVVAKEAGGITQHIGAYQINLGDGKSKVTFLDTPGHEAFTAMRARGAKVTDIVVLVVAADDGIKEQTKEAISHAKAAEVPIIVAINKIDKPGADIDKVKGELMNAELIPEDLGGDVMCVEVSAKEKLNLGKLIEGILLQSEVLELKANPNRAGRGAVIESRLDQSRGIVATLLVQKGTLRVGDIVVAGAAHGKIRSLMDDKGRQIETAPPGMPIEILGLHLAPEAGDMFSVVEHEKTARDIADYRVKRVRDEQTQLLASRSIEDLFAQSRGVKELPIIIKGDVQGSVEAIAGSIAKFENDEVHVRILHTGVGAISESDVTLANATGAHIIAFNVRANPKTREIIQQDKVDVRYYSIIYNVVDDIKAAITGMLSPVKKEKFLGYAEMRQIFDISKAGKVAGSYVTEGLIKRGAKVRLLRDNIVIHEGDLKTLKRFKDEVKEVKSGYECGVAFENYDDIREGDVIEAFEIEEIARTLD